ncbi:putative NADPH-dependent FMN reductase [Octadecabacter antarcticus 307]|uniref:Putative NADPH-dependent FMN reductase n=1 Tax=Octadecabacter antarcticus 307 TaxID=391626 RepID=M9R0U7_9RHOB|nr:NAD(P)H-dependent oxidoreductase [Octadecabacter antarcticus]AGI66284.1 putative NADPH-dependent FMN reductase [Octadecabacter antarcticus 307]
MSYLFGLSGSLRRDSTNTKLMHAAAASFGGDLRIGNLRLSLYDGDLEDASGIPADVQSLAAQIAGARAIVISTPEYNKSISGVLKNALDWVSRTSGAPWSGKPVAIMSATAGRSGGERTQTALRACMMPFRPLVLQGPEMLLGASFEQFDANDTLISAHYQKTLDDLMTALRDIS